MSFILGIMLQMCFLVSVLMMSSVSGRGIDNLREEAIRERAIAESTDSEQVQEVVVCGQKQTQASKRDEETGGLNNHGHSDNLDKILGGSDVTHGDVPWQASYYNNGSYICGGAIISEYWVLTLASCVSYRHKIPYVIVGDHRLSESDEGQQIFEIKEILRNGDYNQSTRDNDIAILQVKQQNGRGIRFNNYVQPICLPGPGESPTDDDRLTVSGFGDDTSVVDRTTDVLRKDVLSVMNRQECRRMLRPRILTDSMLCAFINPDSGVCLADFGGPATYQIGDSHILVGLIADSIVCHVPTSPVVFTNVLTQRDWIMAAINLYGNTAERLIPNRSVVEAFDADLQSSSVMLDGSYMIRWFLNCLRASATFIITAVF